MFTWYRLNWTFLIMAIFIILVPVSRSAAVVLKETDAETPTPTPTPEQSLRILNVEYPTAPIYVGSYAYITLVYEDYFYNPADDTVEVTYQSTVELKFRNREVAPFENFSHIFNTYDIVTAEKDIGEHIVTFTIKDTQNPLRSDTRSISFNVIPLPNVPPAIQFLDMNFSVPFLVVRFEVGDTIKLGVYIKDANGDIPTVTYDSDLASEQLNPVSLPADSVLTNQFSIQATQDMIGHHYVHYQAVDGKDPAIIMDSTFTFQITPPGDELFFTPGLYGNYQVYIRDYETADEILYRQSITSLDEWQYQICGGGANRISYISTGNVLNADNVGSPNLTPGFIFTYGPVMSDFTFPNLVNVFYVHRYEQYLWYTTIDKFRTFSAFPTGNSLPVEYNGGELRTCAGKFLGNDRNQIAVAQGVGGNQVVRLFECLGTLSSGVVWKVVGQFYGLVSAAATNNASGGITIASGDLDNDGIDELIAGQTNSLTSQTQFHVIDVSPEGTIGQRYPYAGYTPEFRGNGGIELAVADLNGDGTREIIVASKGNDKSHGDARDSAPLNLVGIITPIVADRQITGFKRPVDGTFSVWDEATNPSGAISIAAGDLDGNPANGDELLIGTGAMVSVKGYDVQEIRSAPVPKYKLIKVQFDGEKVTGFTHLYHSDNGLTAFGADTWKSGNIFVGALKID